MKPASATVFISPMCMSIPPNPPFSSVCQKKTTPAYTSIIIVNDPNSIRIPPSMLYSTEPSKLHSLGNYSIPSTCTSSKPSSIMVALINYLKKYSNVMILNIIMTLNLYSHGPKIHAPLQPRHCLFYFHQPSSDCFYPPPYMHHIPFSHCFCQQQLSPQQFQQLLSPQPLNVTPTSY